MSDLTAAVEAGARAHFDRIQGERRDDGRIDRVTGRPWQWEQVRETDKHAFRSFVLPIVSAALATAEPTCANGCALMNEALGETGGAR